MRISQASATSGLETGMTRTTTLAYSAETNSKLVRSRPPTTVGIVVAEYLGLPGSSRSGLKARKKSRALSG